MTTNIARLTTPTGAMVGTATMSRSSIWAVRHMAAVFKPRDGFESAFGAMLRGWLEYADSHAKACESRIGDDYVLGLEWESIGKALLGLLNGDIGRFDGGTLDHLIRETLKEQGFDLDV